MKESNPDGVVEFTNDKVIDDETDFAWWVTYTLSKRYFTISSIKLNAKKTIHKYRI